MQFDRRQFFSRAASVAALGTVALSPLASWADTASTAAWPAQGKSVRLIVSYAAGGISDTIARAMADVLQAQLGVPFTVENRAGAGGSLGLEAVARSAADGHTLGFCSISPLAVMPHLSPMSFDPVREIAPVLGIMYSPIILMATAATAVTDLGALLQLARSKPGHIRWGTSGPASLGHFVLEQLRHSHSKPLEIVHVPYRSSSQQLTDALGAQFELLSTNAGPAVMQHIRAGRLRPLAIGAPARLASLPDVPTLAELGFGSANLASYFGIFAPAHTDVALLQRINAAFNQALASAVVQEKIRSSDNVPTGGTAAAFAQLIAQESKNNQALIQRAGIRAE